MGGSVWPFSQFKTVQLLTPRTSAASRWDRPSFSRCRRMCCPIVSGSKSDALRLKDLSEIRMNGKKATPPCKCGYLGHHSGKCRCTPDQVMQYRSRISGPLLDRIDLHVEVPALPESELYSRRNGESTQAVRDRVVRASDTQLHRQHKANARLQGDELTRVAALTLSAHNLLCKATTRLNLSARTHHRMMKVARTIACAFQRTWTLISA